MINKPDESMVIKMKERILLAPSANGTELLRTLAQHGIGTFGLRVMGLAEFADYVLMCSGKALDRELVTSGKTRAMIYEIMQEVQYYKNISFSDAADMAGLLASLRSLVIGDEADNMRSLLADGEFPEANSALLAVYLKYMSALDAEGQTDAVGLVRYAVENAEPLTAEIITLDKYPLSPLGKKLAETASAGSCKVITLKDLFGLQDKPLAVESVTRSYGSMNELRDVLDTILKNGLPYDTCTVVCADSSSAVMLYELSGEFGIPVTFGCGLPISCTYPASLLRLIDRWNSDGMNGITALNRLIFSEQFDKKALAEKLGCTLSELHGAVDAAGSLRLSFDREKNAGKLEKALAAVKGSEGQRRSIELAGAVFSELENGIAYIIGTYAVLRPACTSLDRSAVNTICSELEVCKDNDECFDMLPGILGRRVFVQNSCEGALHIVSVYQAPCALRKNLFITGLTSSAFPGTPKENHLISDNDLLRFGGDAPTSANIISGNRRAFRTLIELASSANCTVRLSYSGYDTAELKENNPSSLLFEVLREINGGALTDDDMKRLITGKGYFASELTADDCIVKAYAEGKAIVPEAAEQSELSGEYPSKQSFSVTELVKFAKCPRQFYYSAVLKLRADGEDDPLEVVNSLDLGNLLHDLMEKNAAARMTEAELLAETKLKWQRFLALRPPIKVNDAIRVGHELESMVKYAYGCDRNNRILKAEEAISFTHSSGFNVRAKLDRLEELPNGALVVADFKTDRKVSYHGKSFAGCTQVMLYAYILEKQYGIKVGRGEYRLVRHDRTIECGYTDEMRSSAEEFLDSIAEAIRTDTFPAQGKTDVCRYCDYKELCGKEAK